MFSEDYNINLVGTYLSKLKYSKSCKLQKWAIYYHKYNKISCKTFRNKTGEHIIEFFFFFKLQKAISITMYRTKFYKQMNRKDATSFYNVFIYTFIEVLNKNKSIENNNCL